MRISYRLEGGFAGLRRTVTLDTAALPDGGELEAAVRASGLLEWNDDVARSGHPDGHVHVLTFEEDGVERTAQLGDPVPAHLRPLLSRLRRAAPPRS